MFDEFSSFPSDRRQEKTNIIICFENPQIDGFFTQEGGTLHCCVSLPECCFFWHESGFLFQPLAVLFASLFEKRGEPCFDPNGSGCLGSLSLLSQLQEAYPTADGIGSRSNYLHGFTHW